MQIKIFGTSFYEKEIKEKGGFFFFLISSKFWRKFFSNSVLLINLVYPKGGRGVYTIIIPYRGNTLIPTYLSKLVIPLLNSTPIMLLLCKKKKKKNGSKFWRRAFSYFINSPKWSRDLLNRKVRWGWGEKNEGGLEASFLSHSFLPPPSVFPLFHDTLLSPIVYLYKNKLETTLNRVIYYKKATYKYI